VLAITGVKVETAGGVNSVDVHPAAHLRRIVGVAMKKLEAEEWRNPVGLQTASQKCLHDHCG